MHALATAAVIVIGDEILDGSTGDENIRVIADRFARSGIDLREVRIVADRREAIIAAVNALRAEYSYVLTTGGLGPTHDDLTADSVAAAFGVGIDIDERARTLMETRMGTRSLDASRLRMARIPFGADLIVSPVAKAPGFRIENVFVIAGVPQIMLAMLEQVLPLLAAGDPAISRTIIVGRIPEARYAVELEAVARLHPEVAIGSYPSLTAGNRITVRSRDGGAADAAVQSIQALMEKLQRA